MTVPFALLPWDSEFFGVTIGRVTTARLTPALGAELQRWASVNAVDCLYFLADPSDADTLRLARDTGFRLVDIRVTLEAATGRGNETAPFNDIRTATADDVPALEAIARTSHHETRFYSDGRFDPRRCDDLYATWIARSCRGDAAIVLVADDGGTPVGYITGHVDQNDVGRIGLFAVAEGARRKGCGSALVAAALGWFRARAMRSVSVVTQARNAAALALYQRAGFHVSRVDLWYHRWTVSAPL